MQKQRDMLQAEYVEKQFQLEVRYLKLYEPIYKKVCILLIMDFVYL